MQANGTPPMLAPVSRPWTALLQLLCVIAAALLVPAVVCRTVRMGEPESFPGGQRIVPATERARLVELLPDWVLIGNSMLNSRINSQALSQLSGHTVKKVAEGGTQSALWFLFLKQLVIASGTRPAWVTVFFRETDLTWPDYRITGQNAELIAQLAGPAQPEWQQVMAWRNETNTGIAGATAAAMKALLPDASLQTYARTRLQSAVFELTELGQSVPHGVRRMELNELFSISGLRHDLGSDVGQPSSGATPTAAAKSAGMADPGGYEDGPLSFDPSPRASFLPHLIALAKANGIRLHFHRVKRRVQANSDAPDGRLTEQYMRDLRAFLAAQHCAFTDESRDPAITPDLFADGDHISASAEAQQHYLATFWQRVRPIIGDGTSKPQP